METDVLNDDKVTFTPEQQVKVNELINGAMGRAAKDLREKTTTLDAELNTAKAALAKAQADLAVATTRDEKTAAKGDVAALQLEIAEVKRAAALQTDEAKKYQSIAQQKEAEAVEARKEALTVRKQVAINKASSAISFMNNDVVATLTEKSIQWDAEKSRFVVLNESGQPRLNSAFDPMSLEEFYNEFAAQNPYLVRGDVKTGIGSTGSRRDVTSNGKVEVKQIFGKGSSSVLAQKLMKENPTEYHRLKGIARESGLIA